MPTKSSQEELDFGTSGGRKLAGAFDGEAITSNGGAVQLGAADRAIGLCDQLPGASAIFALLTPRSASTPHTISTTIHPGADHVRPPAQAVAGRGQHEP